MLEGTTRAPDEVVAVVPPDLAPCTVEKVAINAVMAGCKPEYLPVVLAAVEAACTDVFNIHGLLATTMSAGPVLVVNGPIRNQIGMNAGKNVFGQGNRANLSIGRALQLVVRNVGGGRPGEVDRATLGNPGKVGFCFAEDEEGSPFSPVSTEFGFEAGQDTVMLFPGEGPRTIVDQIAREPESLARSFAASLRDAHAEDGARLRRDPRRLPRALADLPRGGLVARTSCSKRCSSDDDAGRRSRARRGRDRRRLAREPCAARRCRSSARMACRSCMPVAAPGSSRRSFPAGRTARWEARPSASGSER